MNMSLNIVVVTALALLAVNAVSGQGSGTAEVCEGAGIPLSINCGEEMINIKHAAYGVYSNENTCGRSYDGDCISETSLLAMKERCDGKNSCAVLAHNSIFGDPCGGIYKYLTATWECYTVSGTAEACEGTGIPLSINCGEDMINIWHAAYGVYSNENTCGFSYGGDCISETSLQAMKERCDGKNSCAVLAENSIFGDPCGGIYKYLTAAWECSSEFCGCDEINGDDYEATDIKYDMNNKIVSPVRPDLVVNKELTNRGGRDLVVPLSETIEVSNTMEFSHTSGASVTVGTTFEAELPVPGLKVGASLDVSTSLQFSSGEQTTTKKTIKVEFSCTAPPMKRAVCNGMMRKDKVSIPYVMTWTHKKSGCTCKEEGVFNELVSNKVEMELNEYDLSTNKMIRTKREKIFDLQTI